MDSHQGSSLGISWRTSQTSARLGIVFTVFLWASQYPLMHDLGHRWDAYTMLLIRYGAAVALFYGLEKFWARLFRKGPPPSVARRVLLGGAMAGFSILFTLGITIANPVTTAAVAAVAPITASLVAWAAAGERPSAKVFLSLILVVPGAAMASVDVSEADIQASDAFGVLMMLSAQACWSWYSLMGQRWLQSCSQPAITSQSLTWCYPFLIAAYLVAYVAGATTVDYWTSPIYDGALFVVLTLGALVLGVILWNVSVARLGLSLTAIHLNLIPVFAMAIAYAMGLAPRPEQVVGTTMVIAGVGFAQFFGAGRLGRRGTAR